MFLPRARISWLDFSRRFSGRPQGPQGDLSPLAQGAQEPTEEGPRQGEGLGRRRRQEEEGVNTALAVVTLLFHRALHHVKVPKSYLAFVSTKKSKIKNASSLLAPTFLISILPCTLYVS